MFIAFTSFLLFSLLFIPFLRVSFPFYISLPRVTLFLFLLSHLLMPIATHLLIYRPHVNAVHSPLENKPLPLPRQASLVDSQASHAPLHARDWWILGEVQAYCLLLREV